MCTPVPPPRAASPTPAHVSESVRRLAQGRQRLLKRGSPSIGQTQPSLEQSGRRRDTSFKLRKQSKPASHGQSEKDSDDQEGAPRARDSLKPLGPKSSMAHREEPQPAQIPGEPQSSPERRSHMGSYSSSQGAPPLPQMMTSHTIEDEEEEMLKNMPWLNAMIMFSKQFDMSCTHDRFCTKWCFDRVHRQCYRLTEAFNQVYDETIPENSKIDKRKQLIESWQKKQEFNMQKRHSKPRRESAAVRQSGVERVPLALRGLLIEKLNEIEESKSSKKDGAQIPEEPVDSSELDIKRSPMLNYIRTQLLNIIHTPISTMLKSAIIMTVDHYKSILNVSWNLLLNNDPHVVSTAASMFICCSVRCSDDSINLIKLNLSHPDATYRTEAIRRFLALWRNRFHVWLKMEEGAQLIFKVPPPSIDFTLPSPPIGQNQLVVVDPPWMPHVKTKVEELSLKEEEHSTSQTIMTMTRTRRKQKQEMVKKAIREAEERQSELRQQFPLRATAIVQQAAYEPALFHHQLNVQQQEKNAEGEEADVVHATHSRQQQMPVAQPLFPSSILSIVPLIIEMLDDVQVDKYGISVGEVCKKVVWSCIVEDTSLFLRHFLEKLTNKDKQEYLLSLLRKLILTFRPLPSQTAFSLLNYLFGFVMFYVRSPSEGSDKSLALALSVAWLVVPYVHGLYFKDMKQTLKKEQCDQALMITANVPSAKKIIVHGPDSASGGIPSQFPIHEDTQFQQIFTDSLEFFNISENEIGQYFLVDAKTGMVHSSSNYVRDFYFFHRSFYPQLSLVKMNPDSANYKMREMAFHQKMIETGKVLLTYNALKFSPESVIPQRIFFLHDEFTHLPSFPRRSLESSFGMCEGPMGEELKAIDEMHKFVWAKLMSDMFEKMENAFMFGDLHLFINVINGIMILHCEDVLILRRCMATYITMAIHFQTLFASQGFFLIIPTIIRCYSQRQPNRMFVQVVEFVCKQFYILHRKPFLLQMFGAIADMCDQNNNDLEINAMQVKAKYLFNLLRAMENLNEIPDQLDILSLVPPHLKPLKALDLCYRDDPNTFIILTDALASCVTVCAFSPESRRCHQMMLIMQCILPHLIKTMEAETTKQNNAPVAIKHELHAYSTLCVEMKALINSCETLSRAPTRTFDIVTTVSDRGKSFIADSPQFFDPPTTGEDEGKHGNTGNAVNKERKITNNQGGWEANDNAELQKDMFRGPRDALLVLCSMFIEEAGPRLKELGKLASPLEHIKIPELLDHRCHVKLSEIALSLLKIAPYDLTTMGCNGLQKYFMTILPVADWSVETNRSALSVILRRLDKTIAKIGKKSSIRRRANWNSITNWLTGLYNTLTVFPYIAHLHPVKAITQMCLRITVGDQCGDEGGGSGTISHTNPATILNSSIPPQSFCTAVLKLTSFLMQALGQFAFSLEFVCSPEGLGSAAERLEAVLCHILIPLFLRAAMPGKDAPQFQPKDLIYCLNVIHNAISPPLAKQSLAPASSANLASSLIRGTTIHDTTGRQGSVSVAERGHSATVSTHRIIRDSVIQCVFLALKVMILAFTKQLTPYWVKVTKIVKDILAKKVGGQALYTFIEFLNSVNLPISVMLVPIVHNKLTQKVEQESTWQTEFRDKMIKPKMGSSTESIKGYYSLLNKLSQELQVLKEDFSTRLFEVPRSHTPTLGDMHSDSGSVQSVGTHRSSHGRQTVSESRRLSSSTFSKFRSGGGTKPTNITSTAPSESHNIQDTTIMEDTEDETTQMIAGKVQKSPSLPTNRMAQAQSRRSIGGLGMWRSMRKRSSKYFGDDASKNLEMRDMMRRTKSWNKRIASHHGFGDDPVVITPLTMPETQVTSEMSIAAAPTTSSIKTSEKPESSAASVSSSGDRPRIVSFSTPKKEHVRKKSETISEDSEEYCITSTRHLI
uniref:Protein unc-80 homolog n=1 Tax=Acrobeloides nanus TaxID=290746 RepID=A0A914DS60_9BILA